VAAEITIHESRAGGAKTSFFNEANHVLRLKKGTLDVEGCADRGVAQSHHNTGKGYRGQNTSKQEYAGRKRGRPQREKIKGDSDCCNWKFKESLGTKQEGATFCAG